MWSNGWCPVALYSVEGARRAGHTNSLGKRPYGNAWEKRARTDPPEAVKVTPKPFITNTGVVCGAVRPFDVDVDDAAKADAVEKLVFEKFGPTPLVRVRENSPRRLLVYRSETYIPESEFPGKVPIQGDSCKVEVLGHGQQFVAFGDHESGVLLQWRNDANPENMPLASLPAVTEDKIEEFKQEVLAIIGTPPAKEPKAGKAKAGKASGKKSRTKRTDQTELLRNIISGDNFHGAVMSFAGAYAARGAPIRNVIDIILAAFDAVPEDKRDARWQERRDDVERCVRYCYDQEEEKHKPQGPAGVVIPKFFTLNERGLFYLPPPKNGEPVSSLWICAPFEILGRTSDTSHNNHGLYLQWFDLDGERHTWACPISRVHSDSGELTGDLHDAGLRCGTSRAQRDALRTFLTAVQVNHRITCVIRAGWHDKAFVLPSGHALGPGADDIVLQAESATGSSAFIERGTLAQWKEKVAKYATGNDLMILAICCAFMGPLLDIINEPTSGFHIHGKSQTGKTTLLLSAMSVWGPGDERHKVSWRSTDNALEATAAARNGGFLPLDELGLLMSRFAATMGYILGIGVGKNRARRDGLARQALE
jgi:hypothetical protein